MKTLKFLSGAMLALSVIVIAIPVGARSIRTTSSGERFHRKHPGHRFYSTTSVVKKAERGKPLKASIIASSPLSSLDLILSKIPFLSNNQSAANNNLEGELPNTNIPPPGGMVAAAICKKDKDCKENEYCFKLTEEQKGICEDPCTDDFFCPSGFLCIEGKCEKKKNPCNDDFDCPADEICKEGTCGPKDENGGGGSGGSGGSGGKNPTGGPGGTGGAPDGPPEIDVNGDPGGCSHLRVQQVAGHIMKIDLVLTPKCPLPKFDDLYLYGPLQILSKNTSIVLMHPEKDNQGYPKPATDPKTGWKGDTTHTGTTCKTDDKNASCFDFAPYFKEGQDGKSWTQEKDFTIEKYPFYRVNLLPIIKQWLEDNDETDLGKVVTDEEVVIHIGYSKMDFFYAEKTEETPRFSLAIKKVGADWSLAERTPVLILSPSVEVNIELDQKSPQWKLVSQVGHGTFPPDPNQNKADWWTGITNVMNTGSNANCLSQTPDTPTPGYSFQQTLSCQIVKQFNLQITAKGLNHFDQLKEIKTIQLSKPQLTLKPTQCKGKDEKFSGGCGSTSETGQDPFAEGSSSQNVGGSQANLVGDVELEYTVSGRQAEVALDGQQSTDAVSQSTGKFKFEAKVAPTSAAVPSVTVPWVQSVKITPSGNSCAAQAKTVAMIGSGGTMAKESKELGYNKPKPGEANGLVHMVRDFNCFQYTLTATDLDGSSIFGPMVQVGFKSEFSLLDTEEGLQHSWSDYDSCGTAGNEDWCGYDDSFIDKLTIKWQGKFTDPTSMKVTCQYIQWQGAPNATPKNPTKVGTDQFEVFLVTVDGGFVPATASKAKENLLNQQGEIRLKSGAKFKIEPWVDMDLVCTLTAKSFTGDDYQGQFGPGKNGVLQKITANPEGICWTWDDGCNDNGICGPYCSGAGACD